MSSSALSTAAQTSEPLRASVLPSLAAAVATLAILAALSQAEPVLAQDDSLVVSPGGNVGIGTETPAASLHVLRDDGTAQLKVEEDSASSADRILLSLENNGPTRMRLENATNAFGNSWSFFHLNNGGFAITRDGSGAQELFVSHDGDVTIVGDVTANGVVLDSSKALKEAFEPVDSAAVLDRLLSLPLSEWSFRGDGSGTRHLGPFAEDFHAAFGLGASSQHLNVTDTLGVALAAIQGLHREILERDERILELEGKLEALSARVEGLVRMQGSVP